MTEIDKHIKILLDKKDLKNVASFEEMGYCFLGPLVFNYFAWLKNELNECDLVLFNSREGHFLQQIYLIFKNRYNLSESAYFKTSRKLSSIVSFFTKDDIYKTFELHRFEGLLSNLLKNRFGIQPQHLEDRFINTKINIPNIDDFIDTILENSKSVRVSYENYIKSVIKNAKNVVMIDSGFQGMTQLNLEKTYGFKFKGRYLLYKTNSNLDDVKGFYHFDESNLKKNLIFFESIFIDKIGSYIDLENGKFVNEPFNQKLQFFREKLFIIHGVVNFINDMLKFNLELNNVDWKYSDSIFDLMCKKDFIKNEKLFDIFLHDNYYVRDSIKRINRF
ncbi:MAG: hypothetical protein FJ375_00865 [Pelagibacterales bacterium]|nr:hypothetical protein [Pelagibacterales bacterium]